MIEFISECVRTEFHLLPVDRQKEITDAAVRFAERGLSLQVVYVDRIDERISEVSIRINKKSEPGS